MAENPKNSHDKFADFDRMIREAKAKKIQTVIVANPQVLGDDYGEIINNLNRLADAGLTLAIAKAKW